MIYKVMIAGKILAQFKNNYERARDYADRFETDQTVEVYENGVLCFIKWN